MAITSQTFYSNAKLLLTGEYLVMFGAKALALPLKYRQSLKITEQPNHNKLMWIANEFGKEWFRVAFSTKTLEIEDTSDIPVAARLQKLLIEAELLNPQFINKSSGILVETNLDFNRQWGLGTSSTLITNIAKWANIDPFRLNWKVSDGSGYDIACAALSSAIVYQVRDQNPVFKTVSLNPGFCNQLYFVYLGKKQDSAKSIESIPKNKALFSNEIERISQLTNKFINAASVLEAIPIVQEHEMVISSVLKLPPVQDTLFPDFPGAVKSLGAWGGDFVMAISSLDKPLIEQYFQLKGYSVIIPFKEMMIQAD